ncbi:ATP-binding protein [Roseomonas sp. BN140053]|uniref:ATP-binding protein n=1 Tax=Roseomonas sp. BN140053 TaxID=3391898 RepID=UPI0039ED5BD3
MLDECELIASATRPRPLVAAVTAIALLIALFLTIPFAHIRTTGTENMLPAYAGAAFMLELIASVLLLTLYSVRGDPALLILASGYLFSALMVPAWILTFPGLFSALGIEAGLQTTATIAALRRVIFASSVLCYALVPVSRAAAKPGGATIFQTTLCVFGVVGAITWIIVGESTSLPAFMRDAHNTTDLWSFVPATAMAMYLLSAAILFRRRRTTLDAWVCLVLFSLVIELSLLSYIAGGVRLSVGWWGGRIYGLVATAILLIVLLSDTTTVYARLAQSVAAEQRARQNRLTAMEALSASIAHEINQPLASIVTNADAGLRWLTRAEPRMDKVRSTLQAIVSDGHRANKIVSGIRTMFMKDAQERLPLDLNEIIEEVMASAFAEMRAAGVSARVEPAPRLPPVIGNSIQLRQVVWNLVENSIDAMRAVGDRQRHLYIRTRPAANGEVEVSIEDTGVGIEPGTEEQIFNPFFSSKPSGMGMGLMFCRAVVEAHGGRLWTSANRPRGAVFLFTLPGAEATGRDGED